MTARQHPFAHGQLAYVQIPCLDVASSAGFYKEIFGWEVTGRRSFKDASGHVIGAFVADLKVSSDPGVILYIYVHGLDATLDRMVAAGSTVVREPYLNGDLWVATLSDPAGNIIGIWQFEPR